MSVQDKKGSFRKSFHKGLQNGAKLVAENFPVAPSSNTRENISITVEEENYNLFEQLLTNNGQPQKNALWGFRMIEQFLT